MSIAFICPRSCPALIGIKVSLPLNKDEDWFNRLVLGNGEITHLAIQDAALFKRMTGRSKVVNTAGYVYPSKYGNYWVAYIPPYKAMTLDSRVHLEALASLSALEAHLQGRYIEPGSTRHVVVHHGHCFEDYESTLLSLPHLSIDIETTGLKHYESQIRTIGFGISDTESVVFEWDEVKPYLISFFERYTGIIVMHKAAFDLTQLIHKLWMKDLGDTEGIMQGLNILQSKTHCSLILSYVLTNTCAGNELNLKSQTQAEFGDYGVERFDMPLDELIRYNGTDCAATIWLYNKHWKSIEPFRTLYEQLNSYLREVVWMQLCGLPINHTVAVKNADILINRQKELLQFVKAHAVVAQYMTIHRELWAQKKNAKYKKKRVKPEECDEEFNPNSHIQMQHLLFTVMDLPVISFTATKQPSTDGDTLKALVHQTEEKTLLEAFIELSQIDKLITSFIPHFVNAPEVNGHHCLYGFYNIGGTQSGRMSCVAAWTQVKTIDGLIPICELKPGQLVWTHKRRWRPVTEVIIKPVEQMVEIKFSSGYVLTCTTAHRLRLKSGRWVSVEEIINEHIEEVDEESKQYSENYQYNSSISDDDIRQVSSGIGNHLPQCTSYFETSSSSRRIQSTKSFEIFNIERGKQESNEGKNRKLGTSMDWRNRRQVWLSDNLTQWQTTVCSSQSNGSSIRTGRITRIFDRTSHRWQSKKQSTGQSGSVYECRTSINSFITGNEWRGKITSINYCRPLQVWDITVAEDHSYWSEGCFSHNSDSPNQQNIPSSGNSFAKYIKEMVQPPEGWLFVGADFSALEDKIITLLTRDPNRMKVYIDGYDGHSLRAFSYFKDQMPDIEETLESINSISKKYKSLRQDSKAPTFALTYAGTWVTLVTNCGFSEEVAKRIESNFHELYKVSDEWTMTKLKQAQEDGYITLAFGLRLATPVMKASVSGKARPQEAAAEERSAGNALGQSYGLLNSRAAHGFMDRVIKAGLWNDIKPAAQIHDAQYYWIRKSIKLLKWVNDNLIPEMLWDELPELQHPIIKLGGNLIVYSPSWAEEIHIPNNSSYRQIGDLLNENQSSKKV